MLASPSCRVVGALSAGTSLQMVSETELGLGISYLTQGTTLEIRSYFQISRQPRESSRKSPRAPGLDSLGGAPCVEPMILWHIRDGSLKETPVVAGSG